MLFAFLVGLYRYPSLLAQRVKICLQCRRPGFDLGAGMIPWRREWQPSSVFFPGESYGQRSQEGCGPWDCKELDTTEQLTGEGNGAPLQCSRLENPMDGGAWRAAVHGVVKSWTRLSDFTFTFHFHFHALEKEMATHSSVLAWRIPGTAEPGGRPHRVRHD